MRQRAITPSVDFVEAQDRTAMAAPCCARCDPGADAFCAGLPSLGARRHQSPLGHTQFETSTTIFREGDPALHLYVIGAGAVKRYKLLPDGRRQITGFLFRGDIFGLPLDGSYAYTAEAMGPALLCRFTGRRLDRLLDEVPGLEKRLRMAFTQELASAHDQMLLLGRKTARERVASFLVALWHRKIAMGEIIFLPMSRADIADFLGLTIETVSRMFSQFRREGLIGIPDCSHVIIAHADLLAGIAEGI